MSDLINIDEVAAAITEGLENYSQEITDAIKDVVDKVASEVMQEIKNNVTFDQPTGDYIKSFRLKTTEDTKFNKTKTWHVAKPHYRLTHLLESGHALRAGGRSRAFPHIVFGDELAKRRMVELTKAVIEDANKP